MDRQVSSLRVSPNLEPAAADPLRRPGAWSGAARARPRLQPQSCERDDGDPPPPAPGSNRVPLNALISSIIASPCLGPLARISTDGSEKRPNSSCFLCMQRLPLVVTFTLYSFTYYVNYTEERRSMSRAGRTGGRRGTATRSIPASLNNQGWLSLD